GAKPHQSRWRALGDASFWAKTWFSRIFGIGSGTDLDGLGRHCTACHYFEMFVVIEVWTVGRLSFFLEKGILQNRALCEACKYAPITWPSAADTVANVMTKEGSGPVFQTSNWLPLRAICVHDCRIIESPESDQSISEGLDPINHRVGPCH